MDDWLRRYNKSGGGGVENYGRHDSQLKAIKGEIDGAAQIINNGLNEVDLTETVGSVYAKCAQHDRQFVWLWRVFDFFRERFAQRDVEGSPTEKVLRAADDVIWSCYRPFFKDDRREPPPLPYVEAGYSPAALRRDQTPGSLVKRGKELDPLRECLKRMPIPLLQLPPVGLNSVWALALIGHEVGHFIQPAVSDDFVSVFRSIVEEAAREVKGCDDEEAERWGDWSPEIFADWYYTVTMGPWAVWVMGQFELADEAKMLEQRDGYPSRVSRMALLAALTDRYLPGDDAQPGAGARMLLNLGIDTEAAARADKGVAKDMEIVRAVCRAIKTSALPCELGELSDRVRFKAKDYVIDPETKNSGDVDKWAKTLQGGEWNMESRKDVRAARLIVAGAAQAWSELLPRWSELKREMPKGRGHGAGVASVEEEMTYPTEAEEINARALERIAATAEEGKRVGVTGRNAETPGKALGDYLMSAEVGLLETD